MVAEPQPQPDPPQGEPEPEQDWKAEAEKWRGLARKHESEANKNKDAAKRLSEIEAANQSDLERAQAAAKEATDRASAFERELVRLRVASRKGLTENLAARLRGETEEELEADAEELLAIVKGPDQPQGEPDTGIQRRPQERLTPGSRPAAEPQMSARELIDAADRVRSI